MEKIILFDSNEQSRKWVGKVAKFTTTQTKPEILSENVNNSMILIDFVAPCVEVPKDEILLYSLSNIKEIPTINNDGVVTAYYWDNISGNFMYGTSKGRIVQFSPESKKEKIVYSSEEGAVAEIEMVCTTKKGICCFIISNNVLLITHDQPKIIATSRLLWNSSQWTTSCESSVSALRIM